MHHKSSRFDTVDLTVDYMPVYKPASSVWLMTSSPFCSRHGAFLKLYCTTREVTLPRLWAFLPLLCRFFCRRHLLLSICIPLICLSLLFLDTWLTSSNSLVFGSWISAVQKSFLLVCHVVFDDVLVWGCLLCVQLAPHPNVLAPPRGCSGPSPQMYWPHLYVLAPPLWWASPPSRCAGSSHETCWPLLSNVLAPPLRRVGPSPSGLLAPPFRWQ